MNVIIVFLFWIAAPLGFGWGLYTLCWRSTVGQGVTKLILGLFLIFLLLSEESNGAQLVGRLILALHASMAAATAVFGAIDLIAIKLTMSQKEVQRRRSQCTQKLV